MPECDCGNEITRKNAAGHYRDKCWECIEAAAYSPDERRTMTEILEDYDAS